MRKEEKSKSSVVTFRIDEDTYLEILRRATLIEQTPSELVRHIVFKYLQENPKPITQEEVFEIMKLKLKSDIEKAEHRIVMANKEIKDLRTALAINEKDLEKLRKRKLKRSP